MATPSFKDSVLILSTRTFHLYLSSTSGTNPPWADVVFLLIWARPTTTPYTLNQFLLGLSEQIL